MEVKNFIITGYQEVPSGYQFSKEMIEFKGINFKPILSQEYIDKKLVSIEIFKSEGKLKYTIEDLKSDTLFVKSLPIEYERNIFIKENYIIDNNRRILIEDTLNKRYYCRDTNGLNVYSFE